MGKKVHPTGMRLGIVKDWRTNWYANKKNFAHYIEGDFKAREFLMKKLKGAAVSDIKIERLARSVRFDISAARPGMIIGKKGNEVENLRSELFKIIKVPVHITINEVRKPETVAVLVAQSVAQQLERRIMFRRAMKRAIQTAMRQGVKGIKISLSGRLGGAEIARREWLREGRIPLHTFRADIDYGTALAQTTYGIIGIKVWIFKGEIHKASKKGEADAQEMPAVEKTGQNTAKVAEKL